MAGVILSFGRFLGCLGGSFAGACDGDHLSAVGLDLGHLLRGGAIGDIYLGLEAGASAVGGQAGSGVPRGVLHHPFYPHLHQGAHENARPSVFEGAGRGEVFEFAGHFLPVEFNFN